MDLKDYLLYRSISGTSGGAVDDGFYIEWGLDTEGRDAIYVDGYATFYKVSSAILDAEKLPGAIMTINMNGNEVRQTLATDNVVSGTGWVAVVNSSDPFVISGKAGTYSYGGLTVSLPADGTYFLYGVGDYTLYVNQLHKAATQ